MLAPAVSYMIDVSANLVADLALAGGVLTATVAYHLPRRAKVRRLFGLDRGTQISIILSNIWVENSKAVTKIRTGFRGPAGSMPEYLFATRLAGVVERDSSLPRIFGLFSTRGRGEAVDPYGPARIEIVHAPNYVDPDHPRDHQAVDTYEELPESVKSEVERLFSSPNATLVLVGSQVYNAATLYVLESTARGSLGPRASFVKIPIPDAAADGGPEPAYRRGVRTPVGDFVRGEVEEARGSATATRRYRDYFIIRKIADWPHRGTTVFLCSGISTISTTEALRLLADWRSLQKSVGRRTSFEHVYEVIFEGSGDGPDQSRHFELNELGLRGKPHAQSVRLVYADDPVALIPAQRSGGDHVPAGKVEDPVKEGR